MFANFLDFCCAEVEMATSEVFVYPLASRDEASFWFASLLVFDCDVSLDVNFCSALEVARIWAYSY